MNANIIMPFVVALAIPVVILANVFSIRNIINRALKKNIKPYLQTKGFTFKKYKWVGLFSSGDFKERLITIGFGSTNGSPFISVYVYIYYVDNGVEKRITARIDTFMLFIRKVAYSNEI